MEASTQSTDYRNPELIEQLTRPGYDSRLFFHVYEHARETRDEVRERGKWCVYNGQEVDFYVLDWAALGHDYGYYEWTFLSDEVKALYPSREKYAAARIADMMAEHEAPAEKVRAVQEAIWSTQVGVACTSLEGRILRQADLANIGTQNDLQGLGNFLWNTVKLYREDRLLKGKSPNRFVPHEFIAYCLASYKVLSSYNAENVSLGSFDRAPDGQSLFCHYAAEKLPLLADQSRLLSLARKVGFTLLRDDREKPF